MKGKAKQKDQNITEIFGLYMRGIKAYDFMQFKLVSFTFFSPLRKLIFIPQTTKKEKKKKKKRYRDKGQIKGKDILVIFQDMGKETVFTLKFDF